MPPQQQHVHLDRNKTRFPPGYEATTVPAALYGNSAQFEGLYWQEESKDPTTGQKRAGNCLNTVIMLRNASSGTFAAADALVFTSGYRFQRADKCSQAPDATHIGEIDAVVADDYTGTIPIGHLFRAVLVGQNKVKIAEANAVAIGDRLCANGTGTVGLAAIGDANAPEDLNQVVAGEKIIAGATKAATGGAATTVATLCELRLRCPRA